MKNHDQFYIFFLWRGTKKNWIMLTITLFQSDVHPLLKKFQEGLSSVLQLKKNFTIVIEIKWLVECWEQNISKRLVRLNVFDSMLTACGSVWKFTSNYFSILGGFPAKILFYVAVGNEKVMSFRSNDLKLFLSFVNFQTFETLHAR